ncbi:hypothetical protein D3C84_914660 [compost metagenome]
MAGCFVRAEIEEHLAAHVVLIDKTFRGGAGPGDRVFGEVAQTGGEQRSTKAGAKRLELFQVVNFHADGQGGNGLERWRQLVGGGGLVNDQFECVFVERHWCFLFGERILCER